MAIKTFKDYPNTETPVSAENINEVIITILKILGLDKNPFSETKTYAVNDFVTKDYILYKCHTPVTTAGVWTGSANWSEASIVEYKNEMLQIDPDLTKNKKLLWTNPNPNNSFSSSDDIVDVANYKEIIVEFVASTTDSGTHYIVHKFIDDFTTRGVCKTWDSSFGNILSTRDVFIINNKVGCGDGYYLGIGASSNDGQSNQMSIPYKIYGIID